MFYNTKTHKARIDHAKLYNMRSVEEVFISFLCCTFLGSVDPVLTLFLHELFGESRLCWPFTKSILYLFNVLTKWTTLFQTHTASNKKLDLALLTFSPVEVVIAIYINVATLNNKSTELKMIKSRRWCGRCQRCDVIFSRAITIRMTWFVYVILCVKFWSKIFV